MAHCFLCGKDADPFDRCQECHLRRFMEVCDDCNAHRSASPAGMGWMADTPGTAWLPTADFWDWIGLGGRRAEAQRDHDARRAKARRFKTCRHIRTHCVPI